MRTPHANTRLLAAWLGAVGAGSGTTATILAYRKWHNEAGVHLAEQAGRHYPARSRSPPGMCWGYLLAEGRRLAWPQISTLAYQLNKCFHLGYAPNLPSPCAIGAWFCHAHRCDQPFDDDHQSRSLFPRRWNRDRDWPRIGRGRERCPHRAMVHVTLGHGAKSARQARGKLRDRPSHLRRRRHGSLWPRLHFLEPPTVHYLLSSCAAGVLPLAACGLVPWC